MPSTSKKLFLPENIKKKKDKDKDRDIENSSEKVLWKDSILIIFSPGIPSKS